jgi:hypothetical protein
LSVPKNPSSSAWRTPRPYLDISHRMALGAASERSFAACAVFASSALRQHCLYFLPLPQRHGALRPTFFIPTQSLPSGSARAVSQGLCSPSRCVAGWAIRALAPHPPFCKPRRLPAFCSIGAPGGARTPDRRLRRPMLCPSELQARVTAVVEGLCGLALLFRLLFQPDPVSTHVESLPKRRGFEEIPRGALQGAYLYLSSSVGPTRVISAAILAFRSP